MNPKIKELLERAAAAVKTARELAEKATNDGRDMTDDERADFDAKMAEARECKAAADAARKDAKILADAKAFADEIGADIEGSIDDIVVPGGLAKGARLPLEKQITGSAQFKALMDSFGGRIPTGARVHSDPIPVKALITGASSTSAGAFVVADQSGIVEMLGRRALNLRDLISVRTTGSDVVEFVRQTSHTNNAAPVAEATTAAGPGIDLDVQGETASLVLPEGSGVKPEGEWAFERVSTPVKTIAEWVPATKRALSDAGELEGLIRDELVADLADEEEEQILNGDGTGENLTGILETSGIQTQAFDTDIFRSVRKAITKARKVGRVQPNAVVLSPEDVETIDLARESGTSGAFLGAGPFAMGPRTLWGLPIVESEIMPAKTGLVGDFRKAVLWDREQATVTISDSHADFFIRNLVAILAEERVAFAVTRPKAFVETATQA